MALVTKQVEIALYKLPEADSAISIFDSGHALWGYTGIAHQSLSGTLELNRSTLMDGLVGWWPLTEANYAGGVFVDEGSAGNDGTPRNAPGFGINNFRNPTGSTQFVTANNDQINIPLFAEITKAGTWAFSTWLYADTFTTGERRTVFENSQGASDRNGMSMNDGNNLVRFGYWTGAAWVRKSGAISLKTWTHVLGINDGGTLYLYINGVLQTGTGNPYGAGGSGNLYLGCNSSGGGAAHWSGYLADTRIYNRVPTATERALLYTPSLVMSLELGRSYGGNLTPTGDLARTLSAYRAFGGTLTPTGDMEAIVTFVQALGGDLNLSGALSASNPAWLLIDDVLTWMGEWDATYGYAIDDVVLYKSDDGNEWHVFISKIGHNVGNIPTSTAAAWRRLYQEKWT